MPAMIPPAVQFKVVLESPRIRRDIVREQGGGQGQIPDGERFGEAVHRGRRFQAGPVWGRKLKIYVTLGLK